MVGSLYSNWRFILLAIDDRNTAECAIPFSHNERSEGTKMRIKLAAAILALAFGSTTMAQTNPIKVRVVAEPNAESQSAADRLSGQIGSSSRYALVTNTTEDVLLSVDCVPATTAEGQQMGVACDTRLSYWPLSGVPLFSDLVGGLADGDESFVTRYLFDAFVEETSDEKLSQDKARFVKDLNLTIAAYPKGVASLHQSSKARNIRAKLDATIKNPNIHTQSPASGT